MENETFELDEEEKETLRALDNGEYTSIKGSKLHKELIEAAKKNSIKNRNINIRISEHDLVRLKTQALREGIPYQTLAASILHKNADRQLLDYETFMSYQITKPTE